MVGLEPGMIFRAVGVGNAVRWPGIDEIGMFGDVATVVAIGVVPIARGGDEVVVSGVDEFGHAAGDLCAAIATERTTLGEVVLHVDNE